MFAGVLLFAECGGAADLKGYSLSIDQTGNDALDQSLRDSSQLDSLRKNPPETLFALVDRARGDIGRFETALNSFGYYRPRVAVTVAGRDVTAPEAFATDAAAPDTVAVHVAVEPGRLYHLRAITLGGKVPDGVQSALGLATGDPAFAAEVLAGQDKLLARLREDGYAFASVAAPVAYADDAAAALDVEFAVEPGNKAAVGAITFTGLERLNQDFARRVIDLRPGDPYRISKLDAARQNLMALGVFSNVSVHTAEAPDDRGNAPVSFETGERKARNVSFSADFSTDLGLSVSAAWTHHNLWGEAEQLKLSAAATGLGGNATSGIGYDISAQFLKPYFLRPDQQFGISVSAIKQSLDAYDQTAEVFSGFLARKLSDTWSVRAGFGSTYDTVSQEGTQREYQLLSVPLSVAYGVPATNAMADVVSGWRATLSVTPIQSFGTKSLTFAQIQASGSAYFDVFGNGSSVLAVRGLVGSIQGASGADLPPDQRLYAGGSGTVRGFRYQSIGPSFADGAPAGAASVDAASIEWRQRVWGDWGFAAFADAGQAGEASLPFDGKFAIGAGIGLRYYTPIGAVRADIAVPLTHVPQNDRFQIYISLGQAF
jgi:translocation and assembly module TamA